MDDFKSAQGGWMLCEEASDAIAALESEMLRLAVKGRDKISALEAENERLKRLLLWLKEEFCDREGRAFSDATVARKISINLSGKESEADDG